MTNENNSNPESHPTSVCGRYKVLCSSLSNRDVFAVNSKRTKIDWVQLYYDPKDKMNEYLGKELPVNLPTDVIPIGRPILTRSSSNEL